MNSRKKLFSIPLVAALSFLSVVYFPEAAYACSCVAGISQEESFEKAEAVFSGTVTSVTLEENLIQEMLGSGESYKKVRIRVNEAWKGIHMEVVTIGTAQGGASCGYDFEVGTEYLIYALDGKKRFDTELSAGLCGRTMVLASEGAQSDLKLLGEGAKKFNAENASTVQLKDEDHGLVTQIIATLHAELQKFFQWLTSALA